MFINLTPEGSNVARNIKNVNLFGDIFVKQK